MPNDHKKPMKANLFVVKTQNGAPYEDLRGSLPEALDKMEQSQGQGQEKKGEKDQEEYYRKREEIEKIDRRRIFFRRLQPQEEALAEALKEEAAKPVSTAKTVLRLGFSTLLILMVLGVGYLGTADRSQPTETNLAAAEANQSQQTAEQPADTAAETTAVPTTAAPKETTAETAAPAAGQESSGTIVGQLPAGEITGSFGYRYDPTWQDYRFHGGIDIDGALNATVAAVADGTVAELTETKSQGHVITMEHAGSVKSVVWGILPSPELQTGDQVKMGDVIGTITEPPLEESAQRPHWHLELWQNEKQVDPQSLLTAAE